MTLKFSMLSERSLNNEGIYYMIPLYGILEKAKQ